MKTQFVTDKKGKKISVILPIRDYKKILNDLEELEDIKAYDRAKARKSEPVALKKALVEISALRNG
jgi:hypothetical protein